MGRGIDFRGVNLVINYDFPTSAISYIHRVGRTGRAGREGRAVTFFTEDDTVNLRRYVGGVGLGGGSGAGKRGVGDGRSWRSWKVGVELGMAGCYVPCVGIEHRCEV